MTNKDLSDLVNKIIKDNGINKSFISEKLQISRQAFDHILKKKQFSIDDANRILNIIGYEIDNVQLKNFKKVDKNSWQILTDMLIYNQGKGIKKNPNPKKLELGFLKW